MSDNWFWGIIIGTILLNVCVYYFRARKVSAEKKNILRAGAYLFQAMIFGLLVSISLPFIYHYYDPKLSEDEQSVRNFRLQEERLQTVEIELRHSRTASTFLIACLSISLILVVKEFPSKKRELEEPILLNLNDDNVPKEV